MPYPEGVTLTYQGKTAAALPFEYSRPAGLEPGHGFVHFHKDGTYVEDFEGVTDFRVGTYTVDGTKVSLIGDDGNTDAGTVEGETLKFKLGTLTRMS